MISHRRMLVLFINFIPPTSTYKKLVSFDQFIKISYTLIRYFPNFFGYSNTTTIGDKENIDQHLMIFFLIKYHTCYQVWKIQMCTRLDHPSTHKSINFLLRICHFAYCIQICNARGNLWSDAITINIILNYNTFTIFNNFFLTLGACNSILLILLLFSLNIAPFQMQTLQLTRYKSV